MYSCPCLLTGVLTMLYLSQFRRSVRRVTYFNSIKFTHFSHAYEFYLVNMISNVAEMFTGLGFDSLVPRYKCHKAAKSFYLCKATVLYISKT